MMRQFGLEKKILDVGGLEMDAINLRDFQSGRILISRPGKERMVDDFGETWWYVSRSLDNVGILGVVCMLNDFKYNPQS